MTSMPKGYGRVPLGPTTIDSAIMRRALYEAVERGILRWQKSPGTGGSLLDVGCGAQPYRARIESIGLVYQGVDWPQSIHDAGDQEVVQWNLLQRPWPFSDQQFDAILCTEVLEHQADPIEFLAECQRILKPGGTMLFTAPLAWPEHEAPHDYFRYTRYAYESMALKVHVQIEEVLPHGGWHHVMAQLLGFYSYHGFPKPWNYMTRLVALPIMFLLLAFERLFPQGQSPMPMTLGYSVIFRKPSA